MNYKLCIVNYALWIDFGRSGKPSGFPLYLCSLCFRLAPQNTTSALRQAQWPRSRPRIPSPNRSQRMPLQSLTHRRLLKTERNSQFQGSAIRHRLKNVNNFYIFFSWQWMFVIVFLQIYLLSYKLLSLTIILITLRKWTILANVLEKFSLKGKV